MNKYYPGKPVNIHIQPFINITQENNRLITKKKGEGKLPIIGGNVNRLFPFMPMGADQLGSKIPKATQKLAISIYISSFHRLFPLVGLS